MITIITKERIFEYTGSIEIVIEDTILSIEHSSQDGDWSKHGVDYFWIDDIVEIVNEPDIRQTIENNL